MPPRHDDLLAALAGAASSPWAIMPERAGPISAIMSDLGLGRDVAPDRLRIALGVAADAGRRNAGTGGPSLIPAGRRGGLVAIVPVSGICLYDLDFWPFATGMKKFRATIEELTFDSSVVGIVLTCSSPGGTVVGVPEAADAVYAARKWKPTVASISPLSASACFWISSQATEQTIIPSGDCGSIGVFVLHISLARALDEAGIDVNFIKAGEKKTDGNAFEQLSDRARAGIQADVDAYYAQFLSAVARGRSTSPAVVRATFGEGRVVMAREAVRLGMVDRLGTLEESIGAMLQSRASRSASAFSIASESGGDDYADSLRRRLALKRKS